MTVLWLLTVVPVVEWNKALVIDHHSFTDLEQVPSLEPNPDPQVDALRRQDLLHVVLDVRRAALPNASLHPLQIGGQKLMQHRPGTSPRSF